MFDLNKYIVNRRVGSKHTEVLEAEKFGHTYSEFIDGKGQQMIYTFDNGIEASLTIFPKGYPGTADKFEISDKDGIHRFSNKRYVYKHLRNLSLIGDDPKE